jgi:hypothetical protein
VLIPFDKFNKNDLNNVQSAKSRYISVIQLNNSSDELDAIKHITLLEINKMFPAGKKQNHIYSANVGIDMHLSSGENPIIDATFYVIDKKSGSTPKKVIISSEEDLNKYIYGKESIRLLIEISRLWMSISKETCGYNIKCHQMCVFR